MEVLFVESQENRHKNLLRSLRVGWGILYLLLVHQGQLKFRWLRILKISDSSLLSWDSRENRIRYRNRIRSPRRVLNQSI